MAHAYLQLDYRDWNPTPDYTRIWEGGGQLEIPQHPHLISDHCRISRCL